MSSGVNSEGTDPVKLVTSMTRRERRAERQLGFVTARQARLAARLARLDYKVSGETGAMRVPTKARTWHQGNRKNAHAPPPGQGWDRSSPVYMAGAEGPGTLEKPNTLNRRRRPMTNS